MKKVVFNEITLPRIAQVVSRIEAVSLDDQGAFQNIIESVSDVIDDRVLASIHGVSVGTIARYRDGLSVPALAAREPMRHSILFVLRVIAAVRFCVEADTA